MSLTAASFGCNGMLMSYLAVEDSFTLQREINLEVFLTYQQTSTGRMMPGLDLGASKVDASSMMLRSKPPWLQIQSAEPREKRGAFW